MAHRYGNFRNPVHLIRTMVTSRSAAAYTALATAGLGVVARPIDTLWARRERSLLADAQPPDQPLGLIVGGSRTGTTLLYQLTTSLLDTTYLPNVSAAFPRSPITATSRLVRSWRRSIDVGNYFGQTSGWRGPNDGFHVWNRWLGADRYRVNPSLDEAAVEDMRRFFGAWQGSFEGVFVNKNNRNALAVDLIADALPTTRWIATRRHPFFVAQSILGARRTIHGDPAVAWGVAAEDAPSSSIRDVVGSVVDQVSNAEFRLRRQLETLDPDRLLIVEYEDLVADVSPWIDRIAEFLGTERLPGAAPRLTSTNRVTVDDEVRDLLNVGLARRFPDYVPIPSSL